MSIERQQRDKLKDTPEAMESPSGLYRVQGQSDERYEKTAGKRKGRSRSKLRCWIAALAAAVLLFALAFYTIPGVAGSVRALLNLEGTEAVRSFTAQDVQSNYTTTNLREDEVRNSETAQRAIERIYEYFPETRSYEIALAQRATGLLGDKKMDRITIILKEKGKRFSEHPQEVTLQVNAKTGRFELISHSSPQLTNEQLDTAKDAAIVGMADAFLATIGVDSKGFKQKVERTSWNEGDRALTEASVTYKPANDEMHIFQVNLKVGMTSVLFFNDNE
ncbi:hypothetical protein [Paenibacillus apiarius]|uniref:PepSY domain-containing protein n=1 Tax=Paenibacillus apiarius TaxID=46240 RepID=A0ABT4DQL1_9BACL|nr:hypothetical protein [Paenibacillus apiarius]MCY9513391.1 hypothetical protein [Paenibacillus apiarius]MCY9519637.1 hypothetical protein [Paenibacillus apiarius]MCY9553307.1 hypothetical protein [Paenibacillus apiarius]MCY9557157.1 hypothetical protein [Paenibacillus apiarius]MCY9682102.1 hypothetical protein [Paenibacillus apiarius]